ncbi:MAG: LPXTG cell wall anchor domain-containing protein [Candidatus Nanosynbacter sp.]|nr:LPXTG cell wall anchor domain-containing protein [Candidatus Nanosynbacter sp.]
MQGTFKDLLEGAEITAGGVTFKISYVGGDGNDVVLTAQNDSVAPKDPKDPKAPKVPNTGGEKLAVNLIGAIAGVASAAALLIVAKRKSFNKK